MINEDFCTCENCVGSPMTPDDRRKMVAERITVLVHALSHGSVETDTALEDIFPSLLADVEKIGVQQLMADIMLEGMEVEGPTQ